LLFFRNTFQARAQAAHPPHAPWRSLSWPERLKALEHAKMELRRLPHDELKRRANAQVERTKGIMAGSRNHAARFADRLRRVREDRDRGEAATFVQALARGFCDRRRAGPLPVFMGAAAEAAVREDETPQEASWFANA